MSSCGSRAVTKCSVTVCETEAQSSLWGDSRVREAGAGCPVGPWSCGLVGVSMSCVLCHTSHQCIRLCPGRVLAASSGRGAGSFPLILAACELEQVYPAVNSLVQEKELIPSATCIPSHCGKRHVLHAAMEEPVRWHTGAEGWRQGVGMACPWLFLGAREAGTWVCR